MLGMKVLVIEDETKLADYLRKGLTEEGFVVDVAHNGIDGLHLATELAYDLIVLDGMLPGIDGLAVLAALRQSRQTPVLMLTARGQVEDRVRGLQGGADDYLVKPFSLVELEIRLQALVRRSHGLHLSTAVSYADVNFDPDTLEATRAGKPLQLTPTGYKLLAALLREAPKLVRREDLEREVWGNDPPDSDALRTHIHALRAALDKPFPIPLLKTHPGIGYRLVSPEPNAA